MRIVWIGLTVLALTSRAGALDPAKITCTNFRGEAVLAASENVFYEGDTIHWTNCVAYSGVNTNSGVEDLTGLTTILTWAGDVVASTSVTGNVQVATNGTWNAITTLRATEDVTTYFQLTLTNSSTMFTYPFKKITTKARK